MFGIRTLVFSCLIAAVLAAGGTWFITSNYKDGVWGKKLADKELEYETFKKQQAESAAKQAQAVVTQERTNAKTTAKLTSTYSKASQDNAKLAANNSKLLALHGGLLLHGTCEGIPSSKQSNGTSSGASSSPATSTPSEVRITREDSEPILEAAKNEAELYEYAKLAHEYALAVQAQRERMINSQEDNKSASAQDNQETK